MEIREGQSIIDAAIIATGRAEAAIEMAIATGVSVTDDVDAIETAETETDLAVKSALDMAHAEPATAVSAADEEAAPYRGVGFWAIGNDFEIE